MTHERENIVVKRQRLGAKRIITLSVLFGAMLVGILLLFVGPNKLLGEFRALVDLSVDIVSKIPPWQFALLIAIGCSLPIPSSPLFIAAGLAYPPHVAFISIGFGIVGNLLLSYALASWFLRKPITILLAKRNLSPPNVKSLNSWELVLLVRLMPGVPLVFQSYILGLFNAAFLPYMMISWPIAMVGAISLSLAGRGFYDGSLGVLFFAFSLFICAIICGKLVYRYWSKAKQPCT